MSTETMNMVGNCMEAQLAEIIQDDCLDIVDEENITAWDFANYVIYLSKVLRTYPIVEDEYKVTKSRLLTILTDSFPFPLTIVLE